MPSWRMPPNAVATGCWRWPGQAICRAGAIDAGDAPPRPTRQAPTHSPPRGTRHAAVVDAPRRPTRHAPTHSPPRSTRRRRGSMSLRATPGVRWADSRLGRRWLVSALLGVGVAVFAYTRRALTLD